MRDWGGPPETDDLGVGFKPPIAAMIKSHRGERIRKRRGSFQMKAISEYQWFKDHGSVYNRPRQVRVKEMNASKPLKKCRKTQKTMSKLGFFPYPRIESEEKPKNSAQMASGIKMA